MDTNSLITLMIGFGVVAVLGLVVGWAMWESNKAEATSDRHEPAQRMPRYPDMSTPAVTTSTIRTVTAPRNTVGTPMSHPYTAPTAAYQQQPQAPQFTAPPVTAPPVTAPPATAPPATAPQAPRVDEGTIEYVFAPNPSAQPVTVASAAFGPAPTALAPTPAPEQQPPSPPVDEPIPAASLSPEAAPTPDPPQQAAGVPQQPHVAPPRAPQKSVFRLGRVLWVDDDPDSHVPDVVALHRMGLTVTVARHCEAALAYLAAEKYLLVVTDCGREGDVMTTADFIRAVRRNYPGVPTIAYAPGTIVTGPGAPELPHDQVVTTPGELPSVVGRILGR